MAIEFHCSQCGAPLRTPDGTEGAAAQCPRCRAITPVPRPGGSWPPAGSQRETVAWDGGPSAAPSPRSAEAGAGAAGAAGGFGAAGASPFGGPRGSDNPYQSPGDYGHYGAWPMDDTYRQHARQRVAGPATGLIVLGIFGLVLPAIFVVLGMAAFFAVPQWLDASAIPHGFGWPSSPVAAAGALGVPLGAAPAPGAAEVQFLQLPCGFLSSIVILWGGIWMKNLRSYGLAMAASILAMVPCFSPCCLLGLPIGIWALVVLSEPGVKAAFS